MSEPSVSTVDVNGHPCRVWTKGSGPKIGFLAGFGGLPRWIPFLDHLAEKRTVIVPSLPGFPGATGHKECDSHLDWVVAVRQLVTAAGLDGADLAGSSVGGSLAAEMAALWPASVRRLALVAPFGLYDDNDPPTDVWAQKGNEVAGLLCADASRYEALKEMPPGANSVEFPIEQVRASEAAARIFWPLGNTQLARRLPMITSPTLVLWGAEDRVLPQSYGRRIADLVSADSRFQTIDGAGHLAELDKPAEVADAILAWTAA